MHRIYQKPEARVTITREGNLEEEAQVAYTKWHKLNFGDGCPIPSLTQEMATDLKTFGGMEFYSTMRRVISTDDYSLTYPRALTERAFVHGANNHKMQGIYSHMRAYLYQYHAALMFDFWKQKSGVLYEPTENTYSDLKADPILYRKKVMDILMPSIDLTTHPFKFSPFPIHAMRHDEDTVSVLMWLNAKEAQASPKFPDQKRWRRLTRNLRTPIGLHNLHKGFTHLNPLDFGDGNHIVYVEYFRWLVDTDRDAIAIHDEEEIKKRFIKAYYEAHCDGKTEFLAPVAKQWNTKVMVFNKATPIEQGGGIGNMNLLTHLNLLTCLQNPKTVVTQTNRTTKNQRKEAKRKRQKPLTTKTLLVEPETLQQINPLRPKSSEGGGKHSYQYERVACEAKKWVLEANLEQGMEVFAKKPRKGGEGHLYLIQGKRKGAVCNSHLPPKERTIQTVKVKSFKT